MHKIDVVIYCLQKAKLVQGVIEIQNPNLVKPKTIAISFPMQIGKTSVLSRRERYLYFSFTYCLGGSQFSYKWKIY
jgi:hypothetical protein